MTHSAHQFIVIGHPPCRAIERNKLKIVKLFLDKKKETKKKRKQMNTMCSVQRTIGE